MLAEFPSTAADDAEEDYEMAEDSRTPVDSPEYCSWWFEEDEMEVGELIANFNANFKTFPHNENTDKEGGFVCRGTSILQIRISSVSSTEPRSACCAW